MIEAISRQGPWGKVRPISTVFVGTADDAGTTVPGGGHIGPGAAADCFPEVAAGADAPWAGATGGGVEQGTSPANPHVDAGGVSDAVVAQPAVKASAQTTTPNR